MMYSSNNTFQLNILSCGHYPLMTTSKSCINGCHLFKTPCYYCGRILDKKVLTCCLNGMVYHQSCFMIYGINNNEIPFNIAFPFKDINGNII